jgi:hypothetical protein
LDTSRGERLEDTKASFTVVGSWTAYDLTQVAASLTGFWGATFDGQYIYLVPTYNGVRDGIVVRYNTQMTFNSSASWNFFDTTTVRPERQRVLRSGVRRTLRVPRATQQQQRG